MKKFPIYFLSIFLLIACSEEGDHIESQNRDFNSNIEETVSNRLFDFEIPERDIELLQKLGFSGSPIEVYENENTRTNEKYISYLIEKDIEIKSEELPNMIIEKALDKNNDVAYQYRTTIIADPNTYKVFFLRSNAGSLLPGSESDQIISDAVDLALENYNELNLGIKFVRVNYSTRQIRNNYHIYDSDIIIDEKNLGFTGGRAGFPSRVRKGTFINIPYKFVYLDDDLYELGLDPLEQVISHELGHCIGLRHTDFFNRRLSCGIERDENGNIINPNEGQSTSGALHIPGTPATVNTDEESVMTACFSRLDSGEFTNFDIIALNALW